MTSKNFFKKFLFLIGSIIETLTGILFNALRQFMHVFDCSGAKKSTSAAGVLFGHLCQLCIAKHQLS